MHSNIWTTQVVVIRLPLSHGTRVSWSCASILSLKASASLLHLLFNSPVISKTISAVSKHLEAKDPEKIAGGAW